MKKAPTNISASVLARLNNLAKKQKLDINVVLLRYAQERFLSRMVQSGYAKKFVLKGGLLLLFYNTSRARPTKDIDFLGVDVSPDQAELKRIIGMIASIELKDGIAFLPRSITSESITERADYQGVRITLNGQIGKARSTLKIDFGFGDIVTPSPLVIQYPTILDDDAINLLAYSVESVVAEKFEAMVKLATFNTRMKDYYDILFLAEQFDFETPELRAAIQNTFSRRQTSLTSAQEFLNSELGKRDEFQKLWGAFLKRINLATKQTFPEVFVGVRSFLMPPVSSLIDEKNDQRRWNRKTRAWE